MARSKTLYSLSGRLGITDHMDTSTVDFVQEDADGNPSEFAYVVDISGLLSEQLGKADGHDEYLPCEGHPDEPA